jgi:ribonuclease HIII
LTAAEVYGILEVCASTRVTKIQFGNLYVEFGASKEESKQTLPALTQEDHVKLNDAQIQRDADELRQLEKDELMLTNPEYFEELLEKGEL